MLLRERPKPLVLLVVQFSGSGQEMTMSEDVTILSCACWLVPGGFRKRDKNGIVPDRQS
jgi:hypothetical protein